MAGGGILDVDVSSREQRAGNATLECVEIRGVFERLAGQSFGRLRGERIGAEVGGGRFVVPLHQGDGFVLSKVGLPAFGEPVGVGERDGGRQVGDFFEQSLSRCDGTAEHGIDESTDAGFSGLDGFIDGGVVGQAEDEYLAESDAQHVAGFGIDFAVAEFADPVIEQAAVSEHAEKDGLEQAAVGG